MNAALSNMNDSTQGALNVELSGIHTSVTALGKSIADFESRMVQRQQELINEYSKINVTLEQMPTILAQINQQLGSL
jgi:flagellar capping protein FliD